MEPLKLNIGFSNIDKTSGEKLPHGFEVTTDRGGCYTRLVDGCTNMKLTKPCRLNTNERKEII
ncbi:hypothetical protein KG091_00180 [Carnobacteriaceae bacterium zg-ZUI78]|nr:hypothetical protein [Carnobacteriaceae bacterium zg-ZUI78]